MPTGYTAKLCDGPQGFREFALECSRNFGAMFMLRDNGIGSKIPAELKVPEWYQEAADNATNELMRLRKLTLDECEAEAEREYRGTVAANKSSLAKAGELWERLMRMRRCVMEWVPPTPDHKELKKFMLQQLDETIRIDADPYVMPEKRLPAAEWKERAVSVAKRCVIYAEENLTREKERVAGANAWIKALRDSLPSR